MNIPQMPVEVVLRHSCMKSPDMLLEDDEPSSDYLTLNELIQRNSDMRLLMVIAVAVLCAPVTLAHEYCPKAECEETRQKIRQIQSKMRQGYTRRQGEKLEADLRKYRAIRSKKCG